jgi:TetR/AcrR family transcriptional regulator, regulator of cefoperazone and chloramphenicol sensitivity
MTEQPRKRDREASTRAILRAGLEVFSRCGYDAATTKMVSAEAGLNERLITRYFGGKAGLLLAILSTFVEEEASDTNYPPPADCLEEEFRHFLLYRHARLLESLEFFRTFVPRAMVDLSIRDRLEEILVRRRYILHDRMAELQRRHLMRADADLDAACFMMAAQSFYVSFMARVSTNLDDARLKYQLMEFAKYMARGLAPAG